MYEHAFCCKLTVLLIVSTHTVYCNITQRFTIIPQAVDSDENPLFHDSATPLPLIMTAFSPTPADIWTPPATPPSVVETPLVKPKPPNAEKSPLPFLH